ncbi:hypothetical protein DMA15_30245 [Streptomyces sp. WAC 01529]|nr:hypothetical protein DMA15_30245 [Streptomyces sp. WAC 01529]
MLGRDQRTPEQYGLKDQLLLRREGRRLLRGSSKPCLPQQISSSSDLLCPYRRRTAPQIPTSRVTAEQVLVFLGRFIRHEGMQSTVKMPGPDEVTLSPIVLGEFPAQFMESRERPQHRQCRRVRLPIDGQCAVQPVGVRERLLGDDRRTVPARVEGGESIENGLVGCFDRW